MLKIAIDWVTHHSGVIVAVLAMIATFWQGIISRKHNRLSVIPYMATFVNYNKQDDYFEIVAELIK